MNQKMGLKVAKKKPRKVNLQKPKEKHKLMEKLNKMMQKVRKVGMQMKITKKVKKKPRKVNHKKVKEEVKKKKALKKKQR